LPGSAWPSCRSFFVSARYGSAALTGLVSGLDGYYREYFRGASGAAMVFGDEFAAEGAAFSDRAPPPGNDDLPGVTQDPRPAGFRALGRRRRSRPRPADGGMRLVGEDRSQRAAAAIVDRDWTSRARLVVAEDFEEGCGITFYTGQSTQVLGGPGPELLFGYRRGDAPSSFLTPDAFLKEWESSDRVFVLGGRT